MSTPPPPHEAIAELPAYVPGGALPSRPGLTTYKLSSNENPYPPLPGIVQAAIEALGTINRYPDMGCTSLYAALARSLHVEPDSLAAATGSVAVLYHLLQAYCEPGDEVVYAWRSFEAYPIAVAVNGARSVQVPLAAGARHDLAAMADAVTERTKVLVVCTPNNPTGPAITQAELHDFVDRVPDRVLVVVDEAYREFVRMDDPADGVALQRTRPNLVVTRTFAKAYGLAGLRVGYAVAHPEVAAAIRACSLPFGVSGVAQAAAVAALDHREQLLERVEHIVAERDRVVAELAGVGWNVPEPQGNFVWLELGERTPEFAAAAREAGIVVRPFAEGARVSVAEPEANDVVVKVAAGFAPTTPRA